ncbi:hypothetical protein VTN02DRAFT_1953 [Thermoascus thermophilus]
MTVSRIGARRQDRHSTVAHLVLSWVQLELSTNWVSILYRLFSSDSAGLAASITFHTSEAETGYTGLSCFDRDNEA